MKIIGLQDDDDDETEDVVTGRLVVAAVRIDDDGDGEGEGVSTGFLEREGRPL